MRKIYLSVNAYHLDVYCKILRYWGLYLFVICCFTCEIQAQQRTFESVCGKEKSVIIWDKKKRNNIIILNTTQNSEVHHYRFSPSLTTLSWQVVNPTKYTDLTITLYNSNYYLNGSFNNQPYSKIVKSKGHPWHQNIAYSAGELLANKKSFKYECFRPDNLELYIMQAERESIPASFNAQDTYEVKVRLTGVLSHFWSCLYYFSTENHQFIGYKGVNGGPGTPETIIKSSR